MTAVLQVCLLLITTASAMIFVTRTDSNSEFNCRANSSSPVDCNGRGVCLEGVCECYRRNHNEEVIYGRFCECDNFSCARYNHRLCSGPDHGICSCGVCECFPGWTGDACDCRATNETCVPPNGGEICSGHGNCECGNCRCDVSKDGRFYEKFCEKYSTLRGHCDELKDCVQCQMYRTGPLAEICAKSCSTIISTGVDEVEADEEMDEHVCTFYDDADCRYQFTYRKSDPLKVRAQRERECPPICFVRNYN